jgi:hypothetical protein
VQTLVQNKSSPDMTDDEKHHLPGRVGGIGPVEPLTEVASVICCVVASWIELIMSHLFGLR